MAQIGSPSEIGIGGERQLPHEVLRELLPAFRRLVQPIQRLDRAHVDLVVGEDVFLGYAPERVDPGNPDWDVHTTPKLVSGVSAECLRRSKLLYETIVQTVQPV